MNGDPFAGVPQPPRFQSGLRLSLGTFCKRSSELWREIRDETDGENGALLDIVFLFGFQGVIALCCTHFPHV